MSFPIHFCSAPQSCHSHFCHTLSPGLPSAYSDPRHPPRPGMSLSYFIELVRINSSAWFATFSTTTEFSRYHIIEHFYLLLFQLISRMNWQFFKVRDYFLCFWSFRRWQMTDSIVGINNSLLFDWRFSAFYNIRWELIIIYHYLACCIQNIHL